MVELLWAPFVACLVLTAIHVYLGLHVLARGVIFVDLALAQVAALGVTIAFLAGHPIQSEAAYWYALAFTLAGAALFAASRARRVPVPQEAIIGIVYAVSAAAAVLVVDRAPQGGEHIRQILVGSILTATPTEGVCSLPFSCRLIAQLAPGQRQEHAFETWAVDRQPAHPAAEFLEESLGYSVAVSLDDDGVVAAGDGSGIDRADRIGGRGVIGNDANEFASMRRLQRSGCVDRENAAAVDNADAVAPFDLLDVMRRDDDRQSAFLPEPHQVGPDALARLRIKP